jgi:hypothetical protein
MLFRAAIAILAILAGAWMFATVSRASDLSTVQLGEALASLGEADRVRLAQSLRRENFTLFGDVRRKGQIVIVTALRQGAPWRLVIDSASGEIIGRRPLVEGVAFPR